ncbi:phosphoribosylanthranilate isomerase [Campylobacter corcagiensis]|uniref:N-(5'-phosphoribosyl)anthranilate isomerase n=1 Tax=Campylobacter corcagiensis TaxID=1448857 RepID=A0A7M1LDG6_9BACT|nr:phosphoribosylanthranilate isomerase [Campylobacter corcagiensis]QKF65270.1 phosphoribosylanthranilate isomerase [Campylobacter corcagiensis]QOQ86597.1 phosphoribosylanthranilate isomerase [Campylobacter corcagiensis]
MKIEVKICGIKSVDEAKSIINLDIDYLGLIFAESIRKVSLETALEISSLASSFNKKCVGVFANLNESEILKYCTVSKLNAAQIYGDYSQNLYKNLKKHGVEVWRVFSVLDKIPNLNYDNFDFALFDCKGKNLGGNGVSFNWKILKGLKPFSFILAGGIGVQNALKAASYKPKVIDINSCVEDNNDIKDPNLIAEILKVLKENNYK